jgi:phosphoribulokinase
MAAIRQRGQFRRLVAMKRHSSPSETDRVALPGKLFLLAIQFVVVPLVVASVNRSIAARDTDVLS